MSIWAQPTPKLANSLNARRVKLEAPPASGIAAVASEYDQAVAMKRAPVMTKTSGVRPSAAAATTPRA